MDRVEFEKLMIAIKSLFPNFKLDSGNDNVDAGIFWYECLKSYPYQIAFNSIGQLVNEINFLSMADLTKRCDLLLDEVKGITPAKEAWGKVKLMAEIFSVSGSGNIEKPVLPTGAYEAAIDIGGWQKINNCSVDQERFMYRDFEKAYKEFHKGSLQIKIAAPESTSVDYTHVESPTGKRFKIVSIDNDCVTYVGKSGNHASYHFDMLKSQGCKFVNMSEGCKS